MIKAITGYEKYKIDSVGNVYKHDGTIVKPHKTNHGHEKVTLYKDGKCKRFFVHRLVALEFLDKVEGKEVVNHIDGNKENNDFNNLEWVTQSENVKHAWDTGLNKGSSKGVVKMSKDNIILEEFKSIEEAYRKCNLKRSGNIGEVCKGKRKTAYGYKWEYVS